MSQGRLEGRSALITGAARGTGAETARLFAEEGARVLLTDLREELGREVAAEIGPKAEFMRFDVSQADDWTAAMDLLRGWGDFRILVNNAALLEVATIEETDPDRARELLDVNLLGPFLGIRAATPLLREAGGGSIINVASIDALEGEVGVAVYGASKWGLRGLTKCAALELGRDGIRVNTVCPSGGSREMATPFRAKVEQALKEGTKIDFSGMPRNPMGREVSVREIAQAILFLASDESSFCSGSDLAVDGGFTAGHIIPGAPGTWG